MLSALPALDIRDLIVTYGDHIAVAGLNLTADRGKITAIVGPNGAGKTSTIEVCEGYRLATSGRVRIFGLDPRTDSRALRPRIGVMLQSGGVPSGAKPLETLRHMARMYARPLDPDVLAERMGLTDITTTYRRMSGGEQQRLKFAISIIGRPDLVFLDEPTVGLDPEAKRDVRSIIEDLRTAGTSVVLTTHLMDDVEQLADHVAVVSAGKVVATGTPATLRQSQPGAISFAATSGLDLSALKVTLGDAVDLRETGPGRYVATGAINSAALAGIASWCASENVALTDLTMGHQALEDAVISLTTTAQNAAPETSS